MGKGILNMKTAVAEALQDNKSGKTDFECEKIIKDIVYKYDSCSSQLELET